MAEKEMSFERIQAAAITDTGVTRTMNQDQVFMSLEPVGILPNLFIVADGMGGHKAGDLASAEAVRFFVDDVKEHSENAGSVMELMETALKRTNRYVYYMSQESPDYRGMGTTFVVCTIIGYKLLCLNVGDSRLYKVNRAGFSPMAIRQVTEDHSVVELMRRQGMLTDEEARNHPQKNMITRAIGIEEDVEIDRFEEEIFDLNTIMLCSDGLSNMVSDTTILKILTDGKSSREKCIELIDKANENGGKDNISAVVIDLREEEKKNA